MNYRKYLLKSGKIKQIDNLNIKNAYKTEN